MRRLAISLALSLAALIVVAAAQGELIQQGNLRVHFDGSLAPRALPREHLAPVTVSLDGAVSTADGTRPPQLREMTVAVNRAGVVSDTGLPTCAAPEIQQTSSEAALEHCRRALVGHGHFSANVDFPGAPLIPAQGEILAFNSRVHGRPAMLLHLYGTSPVRAAFVLPFTISHRNHGQFGSVFSTKIPQLASDLGYVTEISMKIGRTYRYHGVRHSFLSASCAAPAGFPGGVFQLARATFSFANGQRLTTGLLRDCRVR
ncbi:MAG TPA: hypothetical protein VHR65_05230 [Solirubrobacterales bacterium]|jgi:hypothetical protein|nr:hypothetical protein [Solirubrobacterales bacterium]